MMAVVVVLVATVRKRGDRNFFPTFRDLAAPLSDYMSERVSECRR